MLKIIVLGLALIEGLCLAQSAPLVSLDAPAMAQYCTGKEYGAADQADMAMLPAPYNALMYGTPRWTCAIPVTCSLCRVTLGFVENRLATNITVGQRIFTVTLNGTTSDPIDLVKLAGARKPWQKSWTVGGFDGFIHLTFQSLITGMNATASLTQSFTVR